MKTKTVFLLALLVPFGALAQGFVDQGPTCYSWNGGNFSAGSFNRCNPELQALPKKAPPAPVAAALPAPVLQSPILMPQSAPAPKPVIKRKPKPKMICRPA